MKTFRTTGTGNEQTLSEIETDKIPLYPSEQDLLDDLANLEVGQIAGTIDPAESELIGTLIQRIQALENGEKYSTEEVKTNKKWWNGTEWKDVYRIVIRNPSVNTTLVSGVEELIQFTFNRTYANGDSHFVLHDGVDNRNTIYWSISSGNLSFSPISSNYSASPNFLMLEYTKVSA